MPRSAIARRTESSFLQTSEKVITLHSEEIDAYSNIRSIVNRPSVSSLGKSSTDLIEDILQITFAHSKKTVPDTYVTLVDAVLGWERWQSARSDGIDLSRLVYTPFVAGSKSKREDSSHKELTSTLLRRMLPLSYAVWGAVCLSAAAVFWTMLAYGLSMGIFVIGPWLNLMLCVASTGLSATVLAAIVDWRRKHSGQQPKR